MHVEALLPLAGASSEVRGLPEAEEFWSETALVLHQTLNCPIYGPYAGEHAGQCPCGLAMLTSWMRLPLLFVQAGVSALSTLLHLASHWSQAPCNIRYSAAMPSPTAGGVHQLCRPPIRNQRSTELHLLEALHSMDPLR